MFDFGHYRGGLHDREISGNSRLACADPDASF
jgi:hypothetical protein